MLAVLTSGYRQRNGVVVSNARRKYIEATYDLLVEEGIEGVSSRKVASRAGTSATALYRHFDNVEDLVAAASLRFLHDYTVDARTLSEVDLNPLELNLQLWECFAYYSFHEAPIFENLFFGEGRQGTLVTAAEAYYEEFPEELEEMPDFMAHMFTGDTMFERDYVLLSRAVEMGMLTQENASYLCDVDTYLYRGMLAMIRDTYDRPDVARQATHDFLQLVIAGYQGRLEPGYSILVVEPPDADTNPDAKGGVLNSYRVKIIPFNELEKGSGANLSARGA